MPYTVPKLKDYSPPALAKAAAECIAACQAEAAEVRNDADLKAFRDRWMARKNGNLTQINDLWLKGAPKDAKREAGIRVNELKARITELVEAAHVSSSTDSLTADAVDITLPGIRRPIGAEHPVMRTMHEIVSVFQKLGYSVAEGPVVERERDVLYATTIGQVAVAQEVRQNMKSRLARWIFRSANASAARTDVNFDAEGALILASRSEPDWHSGLPDPPRFLILD